MKKQTFAFCSAFALSCGVIGGLVFFSGHDGSFAPTFSSANPYVLTVDSYAKVQSGATTNQGNPIAFVSSGLSNSGGVGTLSNGDFIYNATCISGIGRITVTLASGSVDIYYGRSSNSSWDDFISGNIADFESIRPNYFKIVATSANTSISSISIQYDCYDYQKDLASIPYRAYVNGLPAEGTITDATKPGEGYDQQYKITLDVYAGDVITFKKNGNEVSLSASGVGNNAFAVDNKNYVMVSDTKLGADLYLKVTGNNHDVWLFGKGNVFNESNMQDGTILQAWNWSVNTVSSNLQDIADAGYGAVQLSPMQIRWDVSTSNGWRDEWWNLYQPYGFRLGSSYGESVLGDKNQLATLCADAKELGVNVIVDVVLNHVCGSNNTSINGNVDATIRNNELIHRYGKANDSHQGTVQGALGGVPDLKTEDPRVQELALGLIKECLDCGVTGFRLDAAKHIETPLDGNYASCFWPYVINGAKRYALKKGYDVPYFYGEALGAGDDRNIDWYYPYMSITTASKSYDLRAGVNSGDISKITDEGYAYGGSVIPSKSVLWAESHDNYQEGTTSGMIETNVNKVYALQAARAGSTAVYLTRPTDENTKIGQAGLTWWKSDVVSAVNHLHQRFAGQGEEFEKNYGDNKTAVYVRGSGEESGAVVVNIANGGSSYSVHLPNMANGTYVDLVSGNHYVVSGGFATLSPGSKGVIVLCPLTGAPAYYLVGNQIFTGTQASWNIESGVRLGRSGDNIAEIHNHRFEEGAEVQIIKIQEGKDTVWYHANFAESYNYASAAGDNIRFDKGGYYSIFLNGSSVYYLTGTPDPSEEPEPEPQTTVTVYFKDASWWSDSGGRTGIYLWKGASKNASWPGVAMTNLGNGIWSYVVDTSQYDNLIFTRIGPSDLSDWGAKTVDISLSAFSAATPMYSIQGTSATWGNPGVSGTWVAYNG